MSKVDVKMMDLGLRILDINVYKKDIPRVIALFELLEKKGSKATLKDVVKIDHYETEKSKTEEDPTVKSASEDEDLPF